ncbi:MAG: DUF89 family protein [Eubacterium sp.]|nr:DUF89 family protein [Eubacterium sp.]
MKADIRYCSTCMLDALLMEMSLFQPSVEVQKQEFNKLIKDLADKEGETPITIQNPYITRLHRLAGYDFYQEMREQDDREMMKLTPAVKEMIDNSEDSFRTALKFAILGNLIDPAGQSEKSPADVLAEAAKVPLAIDDSDRLKERLGQASSILYIADNAGEVALDKMFIDYLKDQILPKDCRINFGVRGTQVHNDARESDTAIVGLDKICTIINAGTSYAGAIIEESSEEFQKAYYDADIIISKGMGNYEVLENRTDKPIALLLVAKCVPISEHLGVERGMPVCKLTI